MIRPKDVNQPSQNRIVEATRQKVLHLGAMFGTEARITKAYRAIFFRLPKNARRKHLEKAVKEVDESFR